jgi:hypothetical protein
MCFKKSFFSVLLSIILFSCVEDKKVIFNEINLTTTENKIVEINIPEATGDKTIAQSINKSVLNVVNSNLRIGDLEESESLTTKELINLFNEEYESFKTDFPESAIEWDSQIDGQVMYHSASVISIVITSYQNTGGAHGLLHITFLNFDVETGKALKNEELFADMAGFNQLAQEYFNEEIADKKDMYFEPDNFTLPANIGFDDDGLFLIYNSYEIAPYSTGLTEIHIPYEEVGMMLNYM